MQSDIQRCINYLGFLTALKRGPVLGEISIFSKSFERFKELRRKGSLILKQQRF